MSLIAAIIENPACNLFLKFGQLGPAFFDFINSGTRPKARRYMPYAFC